MVRLTKEEKVEETESVQHIGTSTIRFNHDNNGDNDDDSEKD